MPAFGGRAHAEAGTACGIIGGYGVTKPWATLHNGRLPVEGVSSTVLQAGFEGTQERALRCSLFFSHAEYLTATRQDD